MSRTAVATQAGSNDVTGRPDLLDTLRYHETPEGIDLELHLAGLMVRIVAWLIDLAFMAIALIVLVSLLVFIGGGVGQGLMLIGFFILNWFYPVLFEVYNEGATPGKKMLHIKVVSDNGTPPGWGVSLVRNLLRTVDFLPVLYGFGMASIMASRDFKRLGDRVAGSLVVYQQQSQQLLDIPQATPKSPPLALTLAEQRALLHFAERSQQLSNERQQELANILSELTGKKDQAAVQVLLQYANALARD